MFISMLSVKIWIFSQLWPKAFDAFCKTEKLGIHQEIHDFLKSTEEKGNLSSQKPNLKIPIIVMWSQKERCYMINILNREHTVAAAYL